MKIKLEKYNWKHFFKFLIGLLNFKILKSAGVFKKNFIKRFIKSSLTKNSKKKFWQFSIFINKKIVGGLDISKMPNGNFNIGVIIFKKYWKKGIALNAVKKAFAIAKKKGAKKIEGINYKDNLASINLVKKLGYKKIGENKEEFFWEKKLK